VDHVNPITTIKTVPHAYLFCDHFIRCLQQLGPGNVHQANRMLEQGVMPIVGQDLYGVTQGLAGNRAFMRAIPTDLILHLHHRDTLTLLGQFHGSALATWSGANYDNVIFLH
jgi:hypothetical protein